MTPVLIPIVRRRGIPRRVHLALLAGWTALAMARLPAAEPERALRFRATTPAEGHAWQRAARARLFALMMGGAEPARGPLEPQLLRRVEPPGQSYLLEELSLRTLPDRRVHVWLARPKATRERRGAVLALHGHGGSAQEIIEGRSLYWYGRELAERGYVVIAPDIGQHELQHPDWTLMGERTWDALRCVDYLVTRPEVDPARLAVAGLSLGGETTMYVAALDERLRLAASSGWLTTVTNMLNGHCACFNFPGLQATFDFADIFACVAPRSLICELGEQEKAPGGFPVSIGRAAMQEIRAAYRVFDAETNVVLTVHPGPHVFDGRDVFPRLEAALGPAATPAPEPAALRAWIRFADGPESFEGTPYYWLARTTLRVTFDVRPAPGLALELGWGTKGDQREAVLLINGQRIALQAGGAWGFRRLRVPLPAATTGERLELELLPGPGTAAFLSEVRLVGGPPEAVAPDLSAASFHARLTTRDRTEPGEAFPAMRPVWDREPAPRPTGTDTPREARFREAEQNARLAAEGFYRCRRYIDGWLAHADPATGLIPRNLGESRDFWNGRDSAADNYPFMVLTAAVTDRPLLEGQLLRMLRTETRLTSRLDRLPDDYSFSKRGWRRPQFNLDEVIFDGAEYVKDGLLTVAEWLGPSPWSTRMIGIIDDIWKHAPIETPFGRIPTLNFEVNGDLLQADARLYWFTGQRKYLDWAMRLGDYYLLGTNHPTRHLKELRLMDHGCEVINGLSELYVAVAHAAPAKRDAYREPFHALLDQVLALGRNEDGLLYTAIQPAAGTHSAGLSDTWGYDYDAFYTTYLLDGTEAYRDAVRHVLGRLKGKYVGAPWADKSADGYADSIEGAINLYNREPVPSAADWIDSQTRLMWGIQKPDGVIEAWHGDGNFARTTLMYCFWKTQGLHVEPWRPDVRVGAVREGDTLLVSLTADQPWRGRVCFDRPRHREIMHLPFDYPRINQFPEWFTVEARATYRVEPDGNGRAREVSGSRLAEGWRVELQPGREQRWLVRTTAKPR